jgi:metal-responsive CopG/Arc/MetJ family transcriptional regulator
MKTAISLSDDLFDSADALARKLGVSRSSLFATAVAEYVAKHRAAKVSERLNAVYAVEPATVDKRLRRAQAKAVERSSW